MIRFVRTILYIRIGNVDKQVPTTNRSWINIDLYTSRELFDFRHLLLFVKHLKLDIVFYEYSVAIHVSYHILIPFQKALNSSETLIFCKFFS